MPIVFNTSRSSLSLPITYERIIMVVLVLANVLTAMLLAGCATGSTFAQKIYILSASSTSNTTDQAKNLLATRSGEIVQSSIKVAYFGLCFQQSSDASWLCARDADILSSMVASDVDPLGIIGLGGHLQKAVLFPGLLIGGVAASVIAFCVTATFPGWHEEVDGQTGSLIDVKPFPSRSMIVMISYLSALTTIFLFAAALWQHVAAATAATLIWSASQGSISCSVGAAAAGLAWAAFGLFALAYLAIVVKSKVIDHLDLLTE